MLTSVVAITLAAGVRRAPAAETAPTTADPAAVDPTAVAIDAGQRFLLAQIDDTGKARGEYPAASPRYGGRTALCVYALLTTGLKPAQSPRLTRALQWLAQAKLKGTYPIAFRVCALAAQRGPVLVSKATRQRIAADAKWLVQAANQLGAYSHESAHGKHTEVYDNENSYLAALAVAAAAQSGASIPKRYWQAISQHWRSDQQPNGGWGYFVYRRKGKPYTNPYGAATAAGVATLMHCFQIVGQRDMVRCEAPPQHAAVQQGLDWLTQHAVMDRNPGKNREGYFFWLFTLQRLGALTGRRHLGKANWYRDGATILRRLQEDTGSFGVGDRIENTAYALLFLAQRQAPVFLSKLHYPGPWNTRPNDAAHLSRFLSHVYETPIGWQVVELPKKRLTTHGANGPALGRVIYLSGTSPFLKTLTKAQIQHLRHFVLCGGMILSEAACDSGDFSLDMHRLYQKLFPRYRLERLGKTAPPYAQAKPTNEPASLLGVSNGVRLLAVHAPRQLSLAMELGDNELTHPTFQAMANLYVYLTDYGETNLPRVSPPIPNASPQRGTLLRGKARTVRLARLTHKGNSDPEPQAWPTLARSLDRDHNVKLVLSKPMGITKLQAITWPIAHLTGTKAFTLTGTEKIHLQKYLADGGTLLADAAGGSEAFANAVETQILTPMGEWVFLPETSPIYQAPYALEKVRYRRNLATTLPPDERTRPRLRAVYQQQRPVILFSREDITAGLVGYPLAGLKGYTPRFAKQLASNLLLHLGGIKAASE